MRMMSALLKNIEKIGGMTGNIVFLLFVEFRFFFELRDLFELSMFKNKIYTLRLLRRGHVGLSGAIDIAILWIGRGATQNCPLSQGQFIF